MMLNGQVIKIERQALDLELALSRQLEALSEKMIIVDGAYHFLPQPDYLNTFLWLLQTNTVAYQLLMPSQL